MLAPITPCEGQEAWDGWMESDDAHTYGIEIDGRINVIENCRLVDDGATAWLEALRVHPTAR